MLTVALRPNVADQLKAEAEQRQTSLEALVNDWLENQLWQARRSAIHQEAERFRAQHAELLARYAGRYVAMRDGVVIDHDADLQTLYARIRAQYGDAPILIAPVTAEPVQTFKVLGARRRRSEP
jgi:hypothetical protein